MKIDTPPTTGTMGGDPDVAPFMAARGWLEPGERAARAARAGEGNMNRVLRVTTTARSLILKQARPWVEKYPQLAAPVERAEVEAAFYRAVASVPEVAARMPRLLASDPESHAILFEDLGDGGDFPDLYGGARIEADDVTALARWLAALHAMPVEQPARFANRAMRALNHERVFALPLDPANGLNLDAITPGLIEAADIVRRDPAFVARATELGRIHCADGAALLHGDFLPGSWLRRAEPMVVDPEFCFLGPPEWDLGGMGAHLLLAGAQPGIDALVAVYARQVPGPSASGSRPPAGWCWHDPARLDRHRRVASARWARVRRRVPASARLRVRRDRGGRAVERVRQRPAFRGGRDPARHGCALRTGGRPRPQRRGRGGHGGDRRGARDRVRGRGRGRGR
jgi:5-methylthioribose kinase